MLNRDKRVPIGFLRGDASEKEIEEFVKRLRAAMGVPRDKPIGEQNDAGGKPKKRVKTTRKKRSRS